LHLGSLLAATASYLDARASGLAWRLRFDDLDEERNQPGAEASILRALESHGLHWDGAVARQSTRVAEYESALAALADEGLLFYCSCSRKDLAGLPVYPGTCRRYRHPRPETAVRIRVGEAVVEFNDLVQGPQREALARSSGDFIVRRRDGLIAYQLATAVDDGDPAITRVVRGRDLLENTGRQIFLIQRLGLQVPRYGHVPLIVNGAGQKLSKQTGARPLDLERPVANLITVLRALGVADLDDEEAAEGPNAQISCAALLAEAERRWSLAGIPAHDVPAEP
jgi:glutamyl-Q tRNA(Asp) synthetase